MPCHAMPHNPGVIACTVQTTIAASTAMSTASQGGGGTTVVVTGPTVSGCLKEQGVSAASIG
jgi:hypothetical protein